SAGSDDQEALPCRDQTRKRIALVHPLAAPSWTAPANHLPIRRNHGSPMVSTRVLQHIPPQSGQRAGCWYARLAVATSLSDTVRPMLAFSHFRLAPGRREAL